ncbi:unnamed protein product, partial [Brachionus calyciflorus]
LGISPSEDVIIEDYYIPATNQYVLVINKVAWYAVRILIETDARFEDKNKYEALKISFRIMEPEQIIEIKVSEHLTLEGAKEKCDQIEKEFSSIVSELPNVLKHTPRITCLKIKKGKTALENPDDYFLPGDHIQVSRNKRVIQISDPENESSKERACVNEADWSKFHCGDTDFRIIIPQGQYDVGNKNCQHFASRCQFGDGFNFFTGVDWR